MLRVGHVHQIDEDARQLYIPDWFAFNAPQNTSHLQHVLTAAALNIIRLDDWWAGAPVSRTRCSRFAALEEAA